MRPLVAPAEAVRTALVAGGVPAKRINTRWTGEGKQQVATADDAAESRHQVVDVPVVKQSPRARSVACDGRLVKPVDTQNTDDPDNEP